MVWLEFRLMVVDSVCHVAVAVHVGVVVVVVVVVVLVRVLVVVLGGKREPELVPVEVSGDVGDAVAVVVRVGVADVVDVSKVVRERVAVVLVDLQVVPVLANVAEAVAGVATYLVLEMEKERKADESI